MPETTRIPTVYVVEHRNASGKWVALSEGEPESGEPYLLFFTRAKALKRLGRFRRGTRKGDRFEARMRKMQPSEPLTTEQWQLVLKGTPLGQTLAEEYSRFKRCRRVGLGYEDLELLGSESLIECARRFDPSRGAFDNLFKVTMARKVSSEITARTRRKAREQTWSEQSYESRMEMDERSLRIDDWRESIQRWIETGDLESDSLTLYELLLENKSQFEIGVKLGCSTDAARKRSQRLRQKLKSLYEDQ